jgi:hypothetical protein
MTSKQSTFAVMVLVLGTLIQAPAFSAPGSAAGRKHAAMANKLAAHNRCKDAVAEFTKAYRLLKDPALLFSRAECYRKIGKDSQAIEDYGRYLAKMPQAPNRSTVEAQIVSLRSGAQAAESSRRKSHAQPRTGQAPSRDVYAQDEGDSHILPTGEEGHAPGAPSVAIGTAARKAPEPQTTASLTTQPIVPEPKRASTSHAWIWIGTAVVVIGAGAFAAYRYWPRPKTDVPQTPLGNYAF